MAEREYSPELCQYIGRVEVEAFHERDSWDLYRCYQRALGSLITSGLSREDVAIAGDVLHKRLRETRPANIGCASGEAGEAD